MVYEVRLTRDARADLKAAVRYYETKREGLGLRFEKAFADLLELFASQPEAFRVIYRDVRQLVPQSFPYGVYLRVRARLVRVIATHHLHRHPSSWQRRAGS